MSRTFDFISGWLCLDLVNTVNWPPKVELRETLQGYADLLRWSEQAGILTDGMAPRLARRAARQPAAGAEVLERALALRAAMHRAFRPSTVAIDPGDLETINAELGRALAHARVSPVEDGYAWGFEPATGALDQMLWPVVRSAADLLTSEEPAHVYECEGYRCTYLFVEACRKRRRRWCDMRVCGNREKVRRHRARKKAE